jgi:hypothetical protein
LTIAKMKKASKSLFCVMLGVSVAFSAMKTLVQPDATAAKAGAPTRWGD